MAKLYTVKQVYKNMYPATYNFKDDADGAEPTGWTSNNADNCTTTISNLRDGHRKVLRLYDNNAAGKAQIYLTRTASADTGMEFYWQYNTINSGYVRFYEGATELGRLRIAANQLEWYDGAYQNIQAVSISIWYHIRLVFNDTANTVDIYVDGIFDSTQDYLNNSTTGWTIMQLESNDGQSNYYNWFDAFGFSTDTDYKIGDNIHWRHYKESTDSFEGDDVGTQGTSITWVDSVDTAASVEIVQEFNEHKKILRQDYTSGAGGNDSSIHNFATAAKDGWFSCWIKVSDVSGTSWIELKDVETTSITVFAIRNGQFQKYTGGAWSQVDGSPTPVNDTWYLIYLKWTDAATDTIDCWIDNIFYETYNAKNNQEFPISSIYVTSTILNDYIYLDAPMSSLDSDSRGDNRLFDYNDSYTRDTITDDIINIIYGNKYGSYRTCILYTAEEWEELYIFQVYDINGKLSFEGEIKNRVPNDAFYGYILRDKNWDELTNRRSNTFNAAKIHDPSDSTCLLKTVLPVVGQEDGDLILVNADTKTDTYSPTTTYYPDMKLLNDIGDLADSCVIIEATGKTHLDDNLASGTSLDIDIAADKDLMFGDPQINDILETINYFEIFGAINPDTGTRFYKEIDNSAGEKKRRWRNNTNNTLRTQTDVDNYAAKLEARIIPVRIITLSLQSVGSHDMGTTMDYKFVAGLINIPQANYYIIEEKINYEKNEHIVVLSEGMVETSKYAADFERSQEYLDSHAAEIYETAYTIVLPTLIPVVGATDSGSGGVVLDAVNEGCMIRFYTEEGVDPSRPMTFTFAYMRLDANNDTINIKKYGERFPCDGISIGTSIWDYEADTLPACIANRYKTKVWELSSAVSDNLYEFGIFMNEAGRSICVDCITIKYFIKKVIS